MAGGCGVGAFCSFCGKCGRVFGTVFDELEVPVVAPPGTSAADFVPEKETSPQADAKTEADAAEDHEK